MYISAINAKTALSLNKNEIKNHSLNYTAPQEYGTKLQDSLAGIARINKSSVSKAAPLVHISFTGNGDKNYNQFAYLTAENKSVGFYSQDDKGNKKFNVSGIYNKGGEGVVASEASTNWAKQGADVRTFQPYHSADNEEGKISILLAEKDTNGKNQFRQVSTDYKLKEGEKFVILQEDKNYIPIVDANVEGTIKKVDNDLNLKEIKYKLFKIEGSGEKGTPTHYVVHVPDAAEFAEAYDMKSQYRKDRLLKLEKEIGHERLTYNGDDYVYSQVARAFVDMLPKLNTEEHGFYNPANHWLHDRQAFHALIDFSEKSAKGDSDGYYNGLKMHSSFHNPGRPYQGVYDNPIDFFKFVGSEDDFIALKANKADYDFVKKIYPVITAKKWEFDAEAKTAKAAGKKLEKEFLEIKDILTEDELERLYNIFDPLIGKFKDQKGYYNICQIAINSAHENGTTCSAGTVSKYFGKEMKDHNTPEIAGGLTKHLAGIPTIDVVNGATPANMATNIIGDFGKAKLNTPEIKNGYTPYEAKIENGIVTNIDEIFAAKRKNTEWLINTVADATKEGAETLSKLFFNEEQLKNHSSILGGLSEYKEGDKLLVGWGRPDPQKGFPTTLDSMLHFFKREDIPVAEKLKVKLLFGAGVWNQEAPDWEDLNKTMKEIENLEGGIYKNNVCYVNGFFPNRLANAATGSIFTSVFEPCGITPLESYAVGNPVISIRTGGAPDFIKEILNDEILEMEKSGAPKEEIMKYLESKTGFLTKNAFLVKPEVLGLDPNLADTAEERALTNARRANSAAEVSDNIKDFIAIANDESKMKKVISNTLLEKIDWHENVNYNGGRSANRVYFEDVFKISEKYESLIIRDKDPMKNLKGVFNKTSSFGLKSFEEGIEGFYKKVARTLNTEKTSFFATKTGKIVAAAGGVVAACGALAYVKNPKVKAVLTPKNSVAGVSPASATAGVAPASTLTPIAQA